MKPRVIPQARPYLALALLGCLAGCLLGKSGSTQDLSIYDFRQGDILLQHIPSHLCSVIADVTQSQYSHCGIVVYRRGEAFVLEAIGPVKCTSLRKWLGQGASRLFTQLRVKEATAEQIAGVVAEAKKMLGKPYDIQYELDENKIYCSELIYKAFLRGGSVEVGSKQRLGDMKWRLHEKFIRHLTGGELPLDREIVTPQALVDSPATESVYSSFPPPADAPRYGVNVLEGTWSGEYTIKGLDRAIATISLGAKGEFIMGSLSMLDGSVAKITGYTSSPLTEHGAFSAEFRDSRDLRTAARAQVLDRGHRIVGTWKDNRGHRGIFSLGRAQ